MAAASFVPTRVETCRAILVIVGKAKANGRFSVPREPSRAEFEISCVRRHALAVEMGRVDHRVQRRVQWMLRKNHKTSEAARQGAYLPIRLRK